MHDLSTPRPRCLAHASRFRLQRFKDMVWTLIADIAQRHGHCSIIDIGGEFDYWRPFLPMLDGMPIEVTIVNLDDRSVPFADARFSARHGDACDLGFAGDNAFDLAHCNSVIEHVGRWPEMRAMAREVRRVAPSYYIQTPYYWFPLEPHFRTIGYQWLPEAWRARLHTRFALGYFPKARDFDQGMQFTTDAVLLDKLQMQTLFPDAEMHSERLLGLTKSIAMIRRDACLGFTESANPVGG